MTLSSTPNKTDALPEGNGGSYLSDCPCKIPLKYIFKTILTIAYLAFLMISWLSCIPALGIKENNILQHGGKHKTKGHEQVAINGLKVRHTGHSTADASYLQ